MSQTSASLVDYVIHEERIVIQFHPVCSIKQGSVIGLEALSRGQDESGTWISPTRLFGEAEREGKTLELDRACRDAAIRAFKALLEIDPNLALFLNMDASIVDLGVVGSGYLLRSVRDADISPERIVIEIVESRARNTKALQEFSIQQRQHGFMLALDDMGTGHSNLERLAQIKPDIIKTDRSLTHHIDREFHKQEILGSLIALAHKVGAVVVAEGIETREEGLTALDRGADLVQGYYFGLPQDISPDSLHNARQIVGELGGEFRGHMVQKVRDLTEYNRHCEEIVAELLHILTQASPERFEACLADAIGQYPTLECAYILDDQGTQATGTILQPLESPRRENYIFRPAERGADHSVKDFVLALKTGLRRYVTDPYVSLATGRRCQTRSLLFDGSDGHSYILCADFSVN